MKKISKIYLAIFGNSAILMEKEQNKWVVCENSFAKGTLRARGFKRNFRVALIAEVISNKDLAAQSWCLFPLFLVGTMECWEFFKAYETEISKLGI